MNVEDAVELVRHRLYGSFRTERNKLSSELSVGAAQINLQYKAQGATKGAYLGVGNEVLFAWGPQSAGSQTILVERGEFGTTPAVHPVGALVEVNPRFPVPMIVDAIREEVRSWPNQLYRVQTFQLPVTNENWVALSTVPNLLRPLRILRDVEDGEGRTISKWELVTGLPSGSDPVVAVRLSEKVKDSTVSVLCATGFDTSTVDATTNLVTDVGVPESALDIVTVGTVWRLMATREVQRTFIESQGDSRRAEENPPTHTISTARALEQIRDSRIQDEIARLVAEYGWRMR